MGEVIEISIVGNDFKLFDSLRDFISHYCNTDNIGTIEIMDNWEYENCVKIENAIDIKKYAENKIVRISFTGKDFDSGIYIESKKNLYYMTGWMNPLEGISEDNYQAIISKAVEYFKSNSLIEICGIGKEIVVDYDNGLFDAIKNAHNVDVWMVSDLKYVTQKKQKYILIK